MKAKALDFSEEQYTMIRVPKKLSATLKSLSKSTGKKIPLLIVEWIEKENSSKKEEQTPKKEKEEKKSIDQSLVDALLFFGAASGITVDTTDLDSAKAILNECGNYSKFVNTIEFYIMTAGADQEICSFTDLFKHLDDYKDKIISTKRWTSEIVRAELKKYQSED